MTARASDSAHSQTFCERYKFLYVCILVLCWVVECSFKCETETLDSVRSGVVAVTVSGLYSTESEHHFTFEVVASLFTALFFHDCIIVVLLSCFQWYRLYRIDQITDKSAI